MIEARSHKSYRPLTVLTFKLNHYIADGLDTRAFHAANILVHSIVTFLVVIAAFIIHQKQKLPTVLTGLFFAVHPIHTEAVANTVGRAELLCAAFYLLSFLSFVACAR